MKSKTFSICEEIYFVLLLDILMDVTAKSNNNCYSGCYSISLPVQFR